jgi:hypothetical protein
MRETKGGGLKNTRARHKFLTPSHEAIHRAGCINYILFSLTLQRLCLIVCGLPRRRVINRQCFSGFRIIDERPHRPFCPVQHLVAYKAPAFEDSPSTLSESSTDQLEATLPQFSSTSVLPRAARERLSHMAEAVGQTRHEEGHLIIVSCKPQHFTEMRGQRGQE